MAAERRLTNVVFGTSPYEEMARLYSLAYASVATLRNIDVARDMRLSKMFPSMSCGVPVIYSGKGEAAQIIEETKVGMTTEPEYPQALADAIAFLVDAPSHRDMLGKNGRALIERDYAWSTIVERWLCELRGAERDAKNRGGTRFLFGC